MKTLLLVLPFFWLAACGHQTVTLDQQQIAWEDLADNEIDEIDEEESAAVVDDEAVKALLQFAEEEARKQELEPPADPGNADDAETQEQELLEAPLEESLFKAVSNPVYLEALIDGHNRTSHRGRENLIFVGHEGRSRDHDYFRQQALKIIDPDQRYNGLLQQPIFEGKGSQFNFWYLDARETPFNRRRTQSSLCSLEKDFEGFEADFLDKVSLNHVTFVHLLPDTDCRSQATWFNVRLDLRIEEIITSFFNWGRIRDNLRDVLFGRLSFYRALTEGVDWGRLFSRLIEIDGHSRVFLNLLDKNRSQPDPHFVDVAIHELGHAFAHFLDEYSDSSVSDIVQLDALQEMLDHTINLTGFLPRSLRETFHIPAVRINLFHFLIQYFDRLGPNCAARITTAIERWGRFSGQGSGDLKIHTTKGCLYYSNLFYRSSQNSKMRNSRQPFNVFQESVLRKKFLDKRAE